MSYFVLSSALFWTSTSRQQVFISSAEWFGCLSLMWGYSWIIGNYNLTLKSWLLTFQCILRQMNRFWYVVLPFINFYMPVCLLAYFMYSWIYLSHWRLFASWELSWCLWDTGPFPTSPQHLLNWNLPERKKFPFLNRSNTVGVLPIQFCRTLFGKLTYLFLQF